MNNIPPGRHGEIEAVMEDASLAASLVFGAALGGFLGVVFAADSAFKDGNEFWVATALARFAFATCSIFMLRKLEIWEDKWLYLGTVIFSIWLYRGGAMTLYWAKFNDKPIHVIFLTWIITVVSFSVLKEYLARRAARLK